MWISFRKRNSGVDIILMGGVRASASAFIKLIKADLSVLVCLPTLR